MTSIFEHWRPVVGWERFYEVSDLGNVRRIGREHRGPLKTCLVGRTGYPAVGLSGGGRKLMRVVHLFVAEAFLARVEGKTEVNHKDGVRTNPSLSNLEWVTPSENMRHAARTGLLPVGEKRKDHKLTAAQVTSILLQAKFSPGLTKREIGERYGVSRMMVNHIATGKVWAHLGLVSGGIS